MCRKFASQEREVGAYKNTGVYQSVRETGMDKWQSVPFQEKTLQNKVFGASVFRGIFPKLFAALPIPFYTRTSLWPSQKSSCENLAILACDAKCQHVCLVRAMRNAWDSDSRCGLACDAPAVPNHLPNLGSSDASHLRWGAFVQRCCFCRDMA